MSKKHDFEERARQNAMNALYQQQSNAFNNPFYRQQYAEAMRPVMTESQKKRHTAKLDESRQLKGHFTDYLTSLEPSGEYISYFGGHDDYEKGFMEGHSSGMADGMNIIERSYAEKGVDLDRFKQECKEVDDE